MRLTLLLCSFLFGILPQLFSQADPPLANALLWRISGNGLERPSYLFGTMHLKDRRLFFFDDSVYHAIEQTQGFAMELDPDALLDSLYTNLGDNDTSPLLKNVMDPEEFKKVSKRLEKKLDIPASKIKQKHLLNYRKNQLRKYAKKDDMSTFMDMYLYNIARKQGKWVGGIEDVTDQLDLKDEFGKDINISQFTSSDEMPYKSLVEKMIEYYREGDLQAIEAISRDGSRDEYESMVKRNHKMAFRMDSIARVRNCFFAVGAAHLPGETGVIQLLKNKGFTLEPIQSGVKLAPEKYRYAEIEIPWVPFNGPDSAYTVEMPGKAGDMKFPGNDISAKVYTDLVTSTVYMTFFTFKNTDESPAQTRERMVKSFAGKSVSPPVELAIFKNGIEGIELRSHAEKVFNRLQVFVVKDKLFMAMVAGERQEAVSNAAANRFFKSFTPNLELEAKPSNWTTYTYADKAFEISLPVQPTIHHVAATGPKEFSTVSYTALDVKGNTFFIAGVSETQKGYMILADSVLFNNKIEYYKSMDATITDLRYYLYEGYPAGSFTASFKKDEYDMVTRIIMINRGNRHYTFGVVVEKGHEDYPDVSRFLRSARFIDPLNSSWNINASPGNNFSSWTPSAIEILPADSTEEYQEGSTDSTAITYVAFEPHTASNYYIYANPYSKYFWAENDSTLLAGRASQYYSDTASTYAKEHPGNFDSLVLSKNIYNGNTKGIELLVRNASQPFYKRIRILQNKDTVYELLYLAPYDDIYNEDNNRFFENFRFTQEQAPTTLYTNKTSVILRDVNSTDSTTRAQAIEAFGNATFSKGDLPLLHQAYLQRYVEHRSDYEPFNDKIERTIRVLADSSSVPFADSNYNLVSDSLKIGLLNILANQNSHAAITALKHHLLNSPPVAGLPYYIVYRLKDSLTLARNLFPECTSLYRDSTWGPAMLNLGLTLCDSGLITSAVLLQNKSDILNLCESQLKRLEKDKEDYTMYNTEMLTVLSRLDDNKATDLLFQFLKINDPYIKSHTALLLLKIGQPVPPAEIKFIAADKATRTYIYDTLFSLGKQKLFPVDYLSQAKFAESYLYNYLTEEDMGEVKLQLVGEKNTLRSGVQKRYFLFKVTQVYDEEPTANLAICGPFDMDKTAVSIKTTNPEYRYFYDEKYAEPSFNRLFKQFISELNAEQQSNNREK